MSFVFAWSLMEKESHVVQKKEDFSAKKDTVDYSTCVTKYAEFIFYDVENHTFLEIWVPSKHR